jgi:hypothetical protein
VIIVEPEKIEEPVIEPVAAPAGSIYEKTELAGDWPLPMDIDTPNVASQGTN